MGSVSASSTKKRAYQNPPPRTDEELPPIAGTTCFDEESFHLAKQRSVSDSIASVRRRFPGALACTTCARIVATTPAGYATSKLPPEQIETYVCYGCRFDTDSARSSEITARFAASRATAAATRLRPPFTAIVPGDKRPGATGTASVTIRLDDACSCSDAETCHHCLLTRAAEVAHGRRVAYDYLATCALNGGHLDADALAECPHPSATIASSESPVFCTHARPIENCIVHAPRRPQPVMPEKLARCRSCLGFHGKTGRDRCPYSAKEAAAVKGSRAAAISTTDTPGMPTGSRTALVANSVVLRPKSDAELHRTISHLATASKRLRRKPGRPATGTSKWARLRKKYKETA